MKYLGNTVRLAISSALIISGLFNLDKSGGATNLPHRQQSPSISPASDTTKRELLQAHATSIADEQSRRRVRETYGKLPLRFEANAGQTDPAVKFLSRGSGYNLFLTPTEAVLALSNKRSKTGAEPQSVVRMKLAGANPEPQLEGEDALPGKSHYMIGNDQRKWRQNVANYGTVRYRNVYPGIDLIYYGNQGQLEYDFVVAAGADPNFIKLDFDGVSQIRVDSGGDLVLETGDAEVLQRKAVVYQEVNGRRQEIASRYILGDGGAVSFKIGAYDRSRPLVIDPVLYYSTFFGRNGNESAEGIAVDAAGNAYVTGFVDSADFPIPQPVSPSSSDAFVIKLNPEGSDLVFSTFLGGNSSELGTDIALDAEGNICLIGSTLSTNFPTVNPLQSAIAGSQDGFVAKLRGDGSALIFSTYLGGSRLDSVRSLKVDGRGDIYVTGFTTSTNFPTVNAFQPVHAPSIPDPCELIIGFICLAYPITSGYEDAFITKLKSDGSAFVFSTYLGGSHGDDSQSLAIDGNGDVYVTGLTSSTDFPTASPLQGANAGGNATSGKASYDAFVSKFNTNGALVYSSYFGGSSNDYGRGISLDEAGNVYLLGRTASTNFPTVNPLRPSLSGSADLYVAKLNKAGSVILYSTYLGGSSFEEGWDLKVDPQGNAFITGYTISSDFPTVNAIQPVKGPGGSCPLSSYLSNSDAFVTKLNESGSDLVYSTYLGGYCGDTGIAIAIDGVGSAYVVGSTSSANFPITPGAFQNVFSPPRNSDDHDAFITKIGDR